MSHLTMENRKTIASMLSHGKKCVEIANVIGCDPTTIKLVHSARGLNI